MQQPGCLATWSILWSDLNQSTARNFKRGLPPDIQWVMTQHITTHQHHSFIMFKGLKQTGSAKVDIGQNS
jgi:hypothetical protein